MYRIVPVRELASGPQNIYEWYMEKDNIDFDPKYQREGLVWSKKEKQLLIDSILNEFDIPKLYVHYNSNYENPIVNTSRKQKLFSIIDGKQRLNSIFEFINNKWPLSDNFKLFNEQNHMDLSGKYYRDLAMLFPSIRTKFDKYKLDVVYVITDDITIVQTMFRRLNSGVSIKNPEIRKAINGFLSEHVENEVNRNPFFVRNVSLKNRFGTYFNIYSKLLLIEYASKTSSVIPNLSKENIDNLFFSNIEPNSNIKDAIAQVGEKLYEMTNIFNYKDPLLEKSGMIILYYLFLSDIKKENINSQELRNFFGVFEDYRKDNGLNNVYNHELQEFNRLNQQGTTRITSVFQRLEILRNFYGRMKFERRL